MVEKGSVPGLDLVVVVVVMNEVFFLEVLVSLRLSIELLMLFKEGHKMTCLALET